MLARLMQRGGGTIDNVTTHSDKLSPSKVQGRFPLYDHGRRQSIQRAMSAESTLKDATSAAYDESHNLLSDNQVYHKSQARKPSGINFPDLSLDKRSSVASAEEESKLKKLLRQYLLHLGLVLMTCTYTLIGATIFYNIEQPYEIKSKFKGLQEIGRSRQEFLRRIYKLVSTDRKLDENSFIQIAEREMINLTSVFFRSCTETRLSADEVSQNATKIVWTFETAIFFATTVVTTIGYGTPVPLTFGGRLMCVFFALIGVPLALLTIADMGKFLSEHLIYLYGCYLEFQLKMKRRWRKFRKQPLEEGVCAKCRRISTCSNGIQALANGALNDVRSPHQDRRMSVLHHDYFDALDIQEETVPATVLMVILVGYTALGGWLLQHLETWTFFEAFYFSFITMTTIGFGDLIPSKDAHMFIILLYIIMGLIITTMCIDLVGIHYVQKIHYFGRKIENARNTLAIIGGKVVYVHEFYSQLLSHKRQALERLGYRLSGIPDAFIIENLFMTKHLIPFIPHDIRRIRYIDENSDSYASSRSSLFNVTYSCKFCHERFCPWNNNGVNSSNVVLAAKSLMDEKLEPNVRKSNDLFTYLSNSPDCLLPVDNSST
uniref:Potassium channel domain-containing protein n=1 Tax=Romanomermis culicivorax TaxID=13658 RepID=A0A915LB74_ROMCU